MSVEEKIVKEREEIIKMINEVNGNTKKISESIAKIKLIDINKLITDIEQLHSSLEIFERYKDCLETTDKWVRVNNELYKQIVKEMKDKYHLTREEMSILDEQEGR